MSHWQELKSLTPLASYDSRLSWSKPSVPHLRPHPSSGTSVESTKCLYCIKLVQPPQSPTQTMLASNQQCLDLAVSGNQPLQSSRARNTPSLLSVQKQWVWQHSLPGYALIRYDWYWCQDEKLHSNTTLRQLYWAWTVSLAQVCLSLFLDLQCLECTHYSLQWCYGIHKYPDYVLFCECCFYREPVCIDFTGNHVWVLRETSLNTAAIWASHSTLPVGMALFH